MLLTIHTEVEGAVLRIALNGEFDANGVPAFREAVAQAPRDRERIEVDLSGVVFMDSSGLQELVRVYNAADEAGFAFVLVRPSHPVERLLELTGLDARFRVAR